MSPSEELRKKLKTLGIRASRGYRMPDGHRTNEDNVTTAWPVYNDPFSTLTFSEEDGSLICEDSLSVDQCVAAVMAETKQGASDVWMQLPRDSNGEPIRIGDTMEAELVRGSYGMPFEVVGYVLGDDGLEPMDADNNLRKSRYLRHQKPDTWERIIEDAIRGDGGSYGCLEERFNAMVPALVARCKKLAGDAE